MDEENRPLILVVNHNQRNLTLLADYLGRQGYRTILVHDIETCIALLAGQEKLDAALVDVSDFDATIWQCCTLLQANNIPFIVISQKQSNKLLQTSIHHGARNVMVKPLVIKELLYALQRLL